MVNGSVHGKTQLSLPVVAEQLDSRVLSMVQLHVLGLQLYSCTGALRVQQLDDECDYIE
jgi:hypothetical protein